MPAFLFDDRQSRQGTRMILIILLGVKWSVYICCDKVFKP